MARVAEGLGDLPRALFEVEAGLRELVTGAQLGGRPLRGEELDEWRTRLLLAHFRSCASPFGDLEAACNAVLASARALTALSGALGSRSERDRASYLDLADWWLDEAERLVGEVAGRPCRWGRRLGEERLRPPMLVNDVAACLHVLAQGLAERWPERREGRCLVARGASEEAVGVCREWSRAVELLDDRGMYEDDDYSALAGYVVGRRVQLRVGSAAGHLTEIDLEKGELRYYDADKEVNAAMKRVLESYAGARCRLVSVEVAEGAVPTLVCELGDPVRAARAVALATSMDIRIGQRVGAVIDERKRECIGVRLAELLPRARPGVGAKG